MRPPYSVQIADRKVTLKESGETFIMAISSPRGLRVMEYEPSDTVDDQRMPGRFLCTMDTVKKENEGRSVTTFEILFYRIAGWRSDLISAKSGEQLDKIWIGKLTGDPDMTALYEQFKAFASVAQEALELRRRGKADSHAVEYSGGCSNTPPPTHQEEMPF